MANYTTEKRIAKVGEKILITKAQPCFGQTHENGDVLTVTREDVMAAGDVLVMEQPEFIDYGEYEVIIEDAKLIPAGTKIKIISPYLAFGEYKEGDVFTVIEHKPESGMYREHVKVAELDDTSILRREFELVKSEPLKVGDRVKLISGGGEFPLFGFKNGEECEITDTAYNHSRGILIRIEKEDGSTGFATVDQLLLKPKPEKIESAEQFSVGDRVEIVERMFGHGFEIGEEVTVKVANDVNYFVENDKGVSWYVCDCELELVKSVADVAPFQAGDIVLVGDDFFTGAFYGEVIDGPRGELSGGNYDIDNGKRIVTVLGDFLTMIAPKGNRVD